LVENKAYLQLNSGKAYHCWAGETYSCKVVANCFNSNRRIAL